MPNLNLKERLVDPSSPERRPRKAAYALPTFFTAGNIFLGFVAVGHAVQGAIAAVGDPAAGAAHIDDAAKAIGWAILLDGLDGRIARMTNTVSEFGKEMDSLADVITFGLAPAVLAYVWGVQFADTSGAAPFIVKNLAGLGTFFAFLFLLCGSLRLARFNVQKNPVPANPGRPDRKYFVGMPIPAAAGFIAAAVHAFEGQFLHNWLYSLIWVVLIGAGALLMISMWRYPSFKEINFLRPRSPLTFVLFALIVFLIWKFSEFFLLALAIVYAMSGVVIRLGGFIRRQLRPPGAAATGEPHPEQQIG